MNKQYHLLLITHEYIPINSGGVTLIKSLCEELLKNGLKITIVTPQIPGEIITQQIEENLFLYRIKSFRKTKGNATLFELISFGIIAVFSCLKLSRSNKFDGILSVFIVPSGWVGMWVKKIIHLKHYTYVGGSDLPQVSSKFKTIQRYISPIIKAILKSSDHIFAGEGLEDFVKEIYNKKLLTSVKGGVFVKKIYFAPKEIPTNRKIKFLTIGRLIERKGFWDIAEALSNLNLEEQAKVEWEVIGYGELFDPMVDFIKKNNLENTIKLLGEIDYDQLRSFYISSDIYIFPSSEEGTSLSMVEALAYGLPVITTNVAGNRELFNDNGYLVGFHDVLNLIEALRNVIKNPEKIPYWSEHSRQIALSYDWENIAKEYLNVFMEKF